MNHEWPKESQSNHKQHETRDGTVQNRTCFQPTDNHLEPLATPAVEVREQLPSPNDRGINSIRPGCVRFLCTLLIFPCMFTLTCSKAQSTLYGCLMFKEIQPTSGETPTGHRPEVYVQCDQNTGNGSAKPLTPTNRLLPCKKTNKQRNRGCSEGFKNSMFPREVKDKLEKWDGCQPRHVDRHLRHHHRPGKGPRLSCSIARAPIRPSCAAIGSKKTSTALNPLLPQEEHCFTMM